MITLAMLAAAGAVATVAPAPACPGSTTIEINACFSQQLDQATATLDRYLAAARKRLRDEATSPDEKLQAKVTLAALGKAEAAWDGYRVAECEAVYDNWITGTIRTSMELGCQIELTRQHTHQVWSDWLTYMDSTPPILPEPPVD